MAQTLGTFLAAETRGRFGASHAELTELLPFAAKLTLECIGNSDALYHNIEHSMLVTLVGHDILIGRHLQRSTTASATPISFWRVLLMTSDMFVASFRAMPPVTLLPTLTAERCSCRSVPRTPRLLPIMSIVPNYS